MCFLTTGMKSSAFSITLTNELVDCRYDVDEVAKKEERTERKLLHNIKIIFSIHNT